jgi:hypothetical protein
MQEENNNLLNESILIEKNIFKNKNTNECINYYIFAEKNKELFLNIYNILDNVNNKKIYKFRNKIIEKIQENINFTEFSIIKSKKNLINFLLTIVILKTLSKQSIYDTKKEENIQHIYNINNSISLNVEKILIFLEISLDFIYEINSEKIFDFTMDIICLLIDKKIIKKQIFYKNSKRKTFI